MSATPTPVPAVSLAQAARYWWWLGLVSFGGPAGQIALMHSDLVERKRWISERRFLHALNYCMLLPGPEATQLAIYIGWLMHRTAGGLIAGILFLLPSLLLLIALSALYLSFGDVPVVAGVLYGIKPAVVAIVLAAAVRIGQRSLRSPLLAGIAVLSFIALALLALPFPAIIAAAALAGAIGGHFLPGQLPFASTHATTPTEHRIAALIDDHHPTPAHAQFRWMRLVRTGAMGVGLAGGAWLALAAVTGAGNTLAQMGWFFTKAALMTFGGAYAVLPYVVQGAVDHYGWLSATQMIDGLALGETTPGPLIMIVAFVGYVGGWTKEVFGPMALFAGACAGALVAAFFTFLPSFVFIFAGAPVVEATRDNLRLSAPLTAITAAVVGVIASLALFFATHTFHLNAHPARWDWVAIVIGIGAALALLRFKVGTVRLLAACAAIGLVVSYSPLN